MIFQDSEYFRNAQIPNSKCRSLPVTEATTIRQYRFFCLPKSSSREFFRFKSHMSHTCFHLFGRHPRHRTSEMSVKIGICRVPTFPAPLPSCLHTSIHPNEAETTTFRFVPSLSVASASCFPHRSVAIFKGSEALILRPSIFAGRVFACVSPLFSSMFRHSSFYFCFRPPHVYDDVVRLLLLFLFSYFFFVFHLLPPALLWENVTYESIMKCGIQREAFRIRKVRAIFKICWLCKTTRKAWEHINWIEVFRPGKHPQRCKTDESRDVNKFILPRDQEGANKLEALLESVYPPRPAIPLLAVVTQRSNTTNLPQIVLIPIVSISPDSKVSSLFRQVTQSIT